jgi:acyl-CoA synthetase (AMP-forming)/AMP-acid ligase II/acyl carrier protein
MFLNDDIGKTLTASFAQTPDRPAILGLDGIAYSFGDLNAARARIARAGFSARHRIATLLPEAPETAVLLLGLVTQVSVLPLNGALLDVELTGLMTRAGVDLLVADAGDRRAVTLAAALDVPLVDAAGLLDGRITVDIPQQRHPRAAGLVLLTSGSTGSPKMVAITPQAMLASARNIGATLNLGREDRAVHALPMFHIGAIVDLLLAPLLRGGSMVVCPERTPTALADGIARGGATWMQLVPTMLIRCLAEFDADQLRAMCASLRFIRSVSADLSGQTQSAAEAACDTPIIQMYGMTETAGQICANPLDGAVRKPNSVGPAAGPEVAILDASGNLLSAGRDGEVCVRGDTVFAGYEDQSNAETFFHDWFRTGDIGHLDVDGYLFLTGRSKEMINQGGEKISPLEIERAALSCAGVTEAAAYPLPHPTLGDQPGLTVVGAVEEAALLAHLAQQLADYKCPRRVQVIDAMPRLGAGKVDKQSLIKLALPQAQTVQPTAYEGQALQIAQLWAQTLQTDLPDADTDFFDAGGDSLAATTFILALEQMTGAPVDPNLLFNAPVFGDLLHAIDEGADRAGTEPPVLSYVRKMMAGWPGVLMAEGGVIRGLGTASAGQPIFWCGTQGYEGEVLQKALGNHHPIYTMMSVAQFEGRTDADRVTTAAKFAEEIQQISPEGPLVLGGFCDGGRVMAFVAEILQNAGREIRCFLAVDHWFTAPAAFPVFHIYSSDPIHSAVQYYHRAELAYRVLYPQGVGTFEMDEGHQMGLQSLQGLSDQLRPILAGQHVLEPLGAPQIPYEGRSDLYRASMTVQAQRFCPPNGVLSFKATVTNRSGQTWGATEDSGFCVVAHALNLDHVLRKRNVAYAAFDAPLAPDETAVVTLEGRFPNVFLPMVLEICVADQGLCDWPKETGGALRRITWPIPSFMQAK